MGNKSHRRMGREAFVPGEECRFKNPDAIEGWNQAKEEWEEQQEKNTDYLDVCKLYDAKNADDLKNWLEEYVLPMVFEDRDL